MHIRLIFCHVSQTIGHKSSDKESLSVVQSCFDLPGVTRLTSNVPKTKILFSVSVFSIELEYHELLLRNFISHVKKLHFDTYKP